MNLHHLELFYYVARHKGIVNACRNMPYGVQQPAVSAQLRALEDSLGTQLFRRRPFALTAAGKTLYGYAKPFFSGLETIERGLRGLADLQLRVAGPSELLRFHVPELFERMRQRRTRLQLKLFERNQHEAIRLIEHGDCSLAVTVKEPGLSGGFESRTLARLPLVIMHPAGRGRLKPVARQLDDAVTPGQPLIAPPHGETITRIFRDGLAVRGASWPTQIEAIGREQIAAYVRHHLGLGLWAETPGAPAPEGTRRELLDDFERLEIHAFWREPLSEVESEFLELLEARARDYPA